MGHDDVASGYPISTSFCRLTGCQRDPRDRGVIASINLDIPNLGGQFTIDVIYIGIKI